MLDLAISFQNVNKKYGERNILEHLSFDIEAGQFVTILGASGSGKTTTLKMINRLIESDDGIIKINGNNIKTINPITLRRQIGYVVQQIGLFPHYNVEKNIATVPEILGWSTEKTKDRVKELMTLVQLPYEEFGQRFPNQLSGGQQQRVGVARALAADPKIMLLDEPFGAVDAITRKELQKQIKNIHQELKDKTFLMVTHDINEAFYLGDKVMVMDEGKLSRYDTPESIVKNPQSIFVRQLMETVYEEENLWRELK